MNKGSPRTPFQEAVSLICIASIVVGLGSYFAALNRVPYVSAVLFTVGRQVYYWFPALNGLNATQAPLLVAALVAGTVFFIFAIPLTHWLAGLFSRSAIKSMERQTAQLKRLRMQRKTRRRNDDHFKVA